MKIVDEIEDEMDRPGYVPNEAEALLLIAHYLKEISNSLRGRARTDSF